VTATKLCQFRFCEEKIAHPAGPRVMNTCTVASFLGSVGTLRYDTAVTDQTRLKTNPNLKMNEVSNAKVRFTGFSF